MLKKRRNLFFAGALVVALLIGLSVLISISNKEQETRSRASASTTLGFQPPSTSATPIQKVVGETVTLDVMISPGNNVVSFVKLEMLYDPTKFEPFGSTFIVNTDAFPQTLEGPISSSGSYLISLSVGPDPTRAISVPVKVGTLTLTAKTPTGASVPSVTFGNQSQVLSIAASNEASENVLSSTTPAFVSVAATPTAVPTPTVTPISAPSTPQLSGTSPNPQQVNLSWTASTGGTGPIIYHIQRNGVRISQTSNTSFIDGTVAPGTHYEYYVNAQDQGGRNSNNSNVVSIDTGVIVQPTTVPTAAPTLIPTAAPTAAAPTVAPTTPSGTTLSLNVFFHSIGNSGDNANPTSFTLSNKTPLHPTRDINVQLLDSANTVVLTIPATLSYDSASGSFKGTAGFNTGASAGIYNIKVKSPTHLRRQIPGIHTLQIGQNHVMSSVTVVAGDINNDNALNILDYNILVGCYSDLSPAASCTTSNKLLTDLNDNGEVNQFDYNLFLREITVQNGQ